MSPRLVCPLCRNMNAIPIEIIFGGWKNGDDEKLTGDLLQPTERSSPELSSHPDCRPPDLPTPYGQADRPGSYTPGKTSADVLWAETSSARQRPKRPSGRSRCRNRPSVVITLHPTPAVVRPDSRLPTYRLPQSSSSVVTRHPTPYTRHPTPAVPPAQFIYI
jgi:hypothetical protein